MGANITAVSKRCVNMVIPFSLAVQKKADQNPLLEQGKWELSPFCTDCDKLKIRTMGSFPNYSDHEYFLTSLNYLDVFDSIQIFYRTSHSHSPITH